MSSKTARRNKRNREKTADDVTSPRNRAVKQKVGENEGAADLDLLSNVASSSDQAGRTKTLGGSGEGRSIYEEIRRDDLAGPEAEEKIGQGKEGTDKAYTSFPDRLMELLESDEETVKKAIWWLPDGDSFAVSPTHFNGKILSRFFRGVRFAQVLQKLSRWGFKRIRGGKVLAAHVYSHSMFRRGQPVLFKKYEAAKLKPSKSGESALTAEDDPSSLLDLGEEGKKEVVAKGQDANSSPYGKRSPVEAKGVEGPKEKESASKMIKDAETSMSFPERLMDLLDSDEESVNKAIWWLPDGDTFAISPNHFSEQILSKYFQGSQFGSFIRKLNRWGFKKTLDDKLPFICYYHEFFKRGMRHLCRQIHSGKKGKQAPAVVTSAPPEPVLSAQQTSQPLQQLLASASAPHVMSNTSLATSLLGSSLLSPESVLLSQMTSLAQQQQQRQQQQQFSVVNALTQQRLADLLALSQLDAARAQLQLGGGLQSLLNANNSSVSGLQSLLNANNSSVSGLQALLNANNPSSGGLQALLNASNTSGGGMQALLSASNPSGGILQSMLNTGNASTTLQSLLSLQNDPLAAALAVQQDQQQLALLQSSGGGLSALQRQILLAQAMQDNGLANFGHQR